MSRMGAASASWRPTATKTSGRRRRGAPRSHAASHRLEDGERLARFDALAGARHEGNDNACIGAATRPEPTVAAAFSHGRCGRNCRRRAPMQASARRRRRDERRHCRGGRHRRPVASLAVRSSMATSCRRSRSARSSTRDGRQGRNRIHRLAGLQVETARRTARPS